MKLYLVFAANEDEKDEFRVAAEPVEVDPTALVAIEMFITADVPQGNAQMYTSGFELDNYAGALPAAQ